MTLRLLCDAIPFCYGPAAALETFLDAFFSLEEQQPDIDIIATGTTRELLARSPFPVRLLDINSDDPASLASVPFASYDAFLDVCNPLSLHFAKAAGTPTTYLDFLLWMHRGPSVQHFDADLYLAENYPGTLAWVEERGKDIANLVVVPPLVKRPAARRPIAGTLLIGLGGLYSRLTVPGENTNYVSLVLKAIMDAVPAGRFERIIIAGPAGVAGIVRPLIRPYANTEYASFSHNEFVDQLARCELFVSHPGLYAAFEAMLSDTPTAFLPPSNYTQILQLRHYRALGLAAFSFAWEDAGLDSIPSALPEEEGVRAVLRVIARAESSPLVLSLLTTTIAGFFSQSPQALQELGRRQQELAKGFGLDGPAIAAKRFSTWLAQVARASS
jgi:hypothetical protein